MLRSLFLFLYFAPLNSAFSNLHVLDLSSSHAFQGQQRIEQRRGVSMGGSFVRSPPENTHILVLPGFGTGRVDYDRQGSLVPNLIKRGWNPSQVHVLPVNRSDWITHTVFRAVTDVSFWKARSTPMSPAYRWYLHRTAKSIKQIDATVKQKSGGKTRAKVILVGHSAGGWLAR